MKRAISFLLIISLAFSLTACDKKAKETQGEVSPTPTTKQEYSLNISAIYPDMAAFEADFSKAESGIAAIVAMRGKLNTVDNVVAYYKASDETFCDLLDTRLWSYAQIKCHMDETDEEAQALVARVEEQFDKFRDSDVFAQHEICANGEAFLNEVEKDERMKPYLNWFLHNRKDSAYTLPPEQEQLLESMTSLDDGADQLDSAIYDDLTFPSIKFPDGTEGVADDANYASVWNSDCTQEFRLEYYEKMMQPYKAMRNTLAQNMQNKYTGLTQSATAHGYASALDVDLLHDGITTSIYNGILDTVTENAPTLNRHLALLKKTMGLEKLYSFEIGANLVDYPGTVYSFSDGQKLLKDSSAPLGADYTKKLETLFSSDTIDPYPAENKSAYNLITLIPGITPYVMLNYNDDYPSLSDSSWQIGFAVHRMYAQSQTSSSNGLPSAIANIVSSNVMDIMLSDHMIKNAKTEADRQYFISQQISSLYSQFYTYSFFARMHSDIIKEVESGGTLTADKLDELWLNATRTCYGDGYTANDSYASGWARAPVSYDNFLYALSVVVASNIIERIQTGDPNAVADYLAFLEAGDSVPTVELLKIAGVDISNNDYIDAFTTRFDRLITEFEAAK